MRETPILSELKTTYAALEQGLRNLAFARRPSQIHQAADALSRDIAKYQKLATDPQVVIERIAQLTERLRGFQRDLTNELFEMATPVTRWGIGEGEQLYRVSIQWVAAGPRPGLITRTVPTDPLIPYFASREEAEDALRATKPLIDEIINTYLDLEALGDVLKEESDPF